MLCLSVTLFDSDPRPAVDGIVVSRGVGIELITILPR
jgi:hypothetical protein